MISKRKAITIHIYWWLGIWRFYFDILVFDFEMRAEAVIIIFKIMQNIQCLVIYYLFNCSFRSWLICCTNYKVPNENYQVYYKECKVNAFYPSLFVISTKYNWLCIICAFLCSILSCFSFEPATTTLLFLSVSTSISYNKSLAWICIHLEELIFH